MSFTNKNEKQNRISFLNVQIICEDKTFITSAYRKPTFNGVYTHFDSFLRSTYKLGTVYTLAYIDASKYAQVELNYTLN